MRKNEIKTLYEISLYGQEQSQEKAIQKGHAVKEFNKLNELNLTVDEALEAFFSVILEDKDPKRRKIREKVQKEYQCSDEDFANEFKKAQQRTHENPELSAEVEKILIRHININVKGNPEFKTKLIEILETTDTEITIPFTYNGKVIEALGKARTIGQFDTLSQIFKVNGVNIFLPNSAKKIGVGAAKIFRYAVTEFTKRNAQNTPKERINPVVFLDINDYAQLNGIDITSSDAMKNFRRKLKGDLEKLRTAGISWTEKIKGKNSPYGGMNYIGKYEVKDNTIMIEFLLSLAQYFVSLPLLPYPRSLYSLDDRDYNAFAIGEAMAIHYGQDNNVIRGTYNKLKIETLLKDTSYPSYDELQAHNWDWQIHVKEPLEQCLDRLHQCGFLKDHKYEPDEKAIPKNYREFLSLLVIYELNGYEDPKKRLLDITKKRAEKMEKLTKARHKKQAKLDN